jgi:hypothetical protein
MGAHPVDNQDALGLRPGKLEDLAAGRKGASESAKRDTGITAPTVHWEAGVDSLLTPQEGKSLC